MEIKLRKSADFGQVFDYNFDLGKAATVWNMLTNPLPIQKERVLSHAAKDVLMTSDDHDLLKRLQDELTITASTKIKDVSIDVANTGYVATSTLGIFVATPMLFDKLGFNFWQNIAASFFAVITDISPTISCLFGLAPYPWLRKLGGEIAKPFVLKETRKAADAFLKSEGILK